MLTVTKDILDYVNGIGNKRMSANQYLHSLLERKQAYYPRPFNYSINRPCEIGTMAASLTLMQANFSDRDDRPVG